MPSSLTIVSIRQDLAQLQALEQEWESSPYHDQNNSSPRGVDNDSTLLLERYTQARDLYLQRRMENLLVDHVVLGAWDGSEFTMPLPQSTSTTTSKETDDADNVALVELQTTVTKLTTQLGQWKDTYQLVRERRRELQAMLQDLEQEPNDPDDNDDDDDGGQQDDTNDFGASEAELALEQERIEELQQKKRQLQEKLRKLQQETKTKREQLLGHKEQVAFLQQQQRASSNTIPPPEELDSKISELREMTLFYDSMREVLEELGGMRIQNILPGTTNQEVLLDLEFYQTYGMRVTLEVQNKRELRLLHAQWTTNEESSKSSLPPRVYYQADDKESFSLALPAVNDLVEVARSTMGPPHDIRFLIREVLARIRWIQARVKDLGDLRTRVLTKIVVPQQQQQEQQQPDNTSMEQQQQPTTIPVVCSLEQGLVIVLRLYEQHTTVEELVGVGEWVTSPSHSKLLQDWEAQLKQESTLRPASAIVEQFQGMVQAFQQESGAGLDWKTPRLPQRAGAASSTTAFFGNDNDDTASISSSHIVNNKNKTNDQEDVTMEEMET